MNVRKGTLAASFDKADGNRRYLYRLDGQDATLQLDVSPFPVHAFNASTGDTLKVEVKDDVLHARLLASDDRLVDVVALPVSPERRARQDKFDAVFAGTKFATPLPLHSHPVMQPPQ